MNLYLTKKAENNRWWDIPVLFASGGMVALCVEVAAGEFDPSAPATSILAGLTVTALFAIPMIRVIMHRVRQTWARKVAKKLAIRREEAHPCDGLERLTGLSKAEPRIRVLLSKGYLQNMGFDDQSQCLRVLKPPFNEPVESGERPEPATLEREEFNDMLRRIRELNDEIDDRAVSGRIDRIEALTTDIFRLVEQKPDRASDMRRFMNYYLPATFKLLESYSLMEKQTYQGSNIRASRKQIEDVLDTLVKAIEQQQDKLFRADALDVETDISVLKTMLASDGLTQQEGVTLPSDGHD